MKLSGMLRFGVDTWKEEKERDSPSCLAWRHSIDVRLSRSTTITVTRKLLCNRLHLLQLSSLNWCSSLHLLLLLELSRAINVLASHEGARDSFDFILRSHDKMWNDLFQKRLFVEDLLWLAIWKKTQWKEWIVRFIYRLQDKIDLGLLLLLLLLRWCTANKNVSRVSTAYARNRRSIKSQVPIIIKYAAISLKSEDGNNFLFLHKLSRWSETFLIS